MAQESLKDEDRDYFRSLLLQQREELIEGLLPLREGNTNGVVHPDHLAETASAENQNQVDLLLVERGDGQLLRIEEALQRIDGTYGLCQKCKVLIPRERLEAVPTTIHCIDCKE